MIPLFALLDPYVALASTLPDEPWDAVQAYVGQAIQGGSSDALRSPRLPAFVLVGASPLVAQRAAVEHWAPILAGLRRLSDSPYERESRDADGLAKLKSLEKFVFYAAHVRFADGDRHAAVTVLLDGLTMARRIRSGPTLDALVGTACEAIVMSSFEEHLPQIPLDECERVRKRADAYLAEGLPTPEDASATIRNTLADAPWRWVLKEADPTLPAFAKSLTQMRLLRLHMRIEAYRWRNLKLPVGLKDAAPEAEFVDPIVEEPYRYERTETGYRLTSAGFASMGPMGLRYRRDPALASPDEGDKGGKP